MDLLSYMHPNKGMLKGWLKGTHVHHSMKASMLKKGVLKGGTKEHMHTQHEGMHLHPRDTTISSIMTFQIMCVDHTKTTLKNIIAYYHFISSTMTLQKRYVF